MIAEIEEKIFNFQKVLSKSKVLFYDIANNAPFFIFLADENNLCTWSNKQWLDYNGHENNIQDKCWLRITDIHIDDISGCLTKTSIAISMYKPFDLRFRLKRSDGVYCRIKLSGVPRLSVDGEFEGYILCGMEITKPKLVKIEKNHLFSTKLLSDTGRVRSPDD